MPIGYCLLWSVYSNEHEGEVNKNAIQIAESSRKLRRSYSR